MNIKEAINILEKHNVWRRGDEKLPATDPTQLGIAIDTVVKHHKKKKETGFVIDFFELSFLIEASIPPRPIARTMFWHNVIDKYYHQMSKLQRSELYQWMHLNPVYEESLTKEYDTKVFDARFDPNNQYTVTAKGQQFECFKLDGRFYTERNKSIIPEYIERIEKTS